MHQEITVSKWWHLPLMSKSLNHRRGTTTLFQLWGMQCSSDVTDLCFSTDLYMYSHTVIWLDLGKKIIYHFWILAWCYCNRQRLNVFQKQGMARGEWAEGCSYSHVFTSQWGAEIKVSVLSWKILSNQMCPFPSTTIIQQFSPPLCLHRSQ